MKGVILSVAATLLAVPAIAAAQGPPGIEVTSITASPSSFQPGTAVTFTLEIKNTGTRKTKSGTVYLDVFKGESYEASDHLWGVTQTVGRLDPGSTEIVSFAGRSEMRGAMRSLVWTVPATGTETYVVRAGVVEPPIESAHFKTAKFVRKCTYSKPGPITKAPSVSVSDLKRLKR